MIRELLLASLVVAVRGSPFGGRIVGGESVSIQKIPYQVSVQYFGGHWCGGSILNKRHILTAAHCTDKRPARDYTVRVGSSKHASGGQVIKVAEILQHPWYEPYDYDVCILVLEEDIIFNKRAQPTVLANNDPPSNVNCTVSGWGNLEEGVNVFPDVLQKVTVPSISRDDCRNIIGSNKISEQMICAGDSNGGHNSCQGDSGGPLVCEGVQVGMVSWAYGCARPNNATVFASVAALREFIDVNSN